MIRSNDPKLKAVEGEVFKDEDFEEENAAAGKKDGKALTYKDMIREDVLRKGEEAESSGDEEGLFKKKKKKRGDGETAVEEEERLKREFKKAALE